MKKISLIILTVFLLFTVSFEYVYPEKMAKLSEITNPYKMIIEKDRLFISEGASIFIYSLPECQLLKKFGKQGEGPGEFKTNPNMNLGSLQFDIFSDFLVIYSVGRISFYTKEGEYIKEMKFSSSSGYFKPLLESKNNNFVGIASAVEDKVYYSTVNIYNQELEKLKELYREKFWFLPGKPIDIFCAMRGVTFDISGNVIFIEKEKNSILLFNQEGEQIGSFTPPCHPLEITSEKKEEFVDVLKNSSQFKPFYQRFQNLIKFPEVFPTVRTTVMADKKLYLITWKRIEGNSETYVYDTETKSYEKILLPLQEIDVIITYPFTVANNKLYQLVENENTGDWELLTDKL